MKDPQLHDAATGLRIGPATRAQFDASLATENGLILIDLDGDVITQDSWAAQQPGVRTVWVD